MGRTDLDFTAELDIALTLKKPLVLEFFFPLVSPPTSLVMAIPHSLLLSIFSHDFSGSQRAPKFLCSPDLS